MGTLQAFLDDYLPTVNGTVDYIHGADEMCIRDRLIATRIRAPGGSFI